MSAPTGEAEGGGGGGLSLWRVELRLTLKKVEGEFWRGLIAVEPEEGRVEFTDAQGRHNFTWPLLAFKRQRKHPKIVGLLQQEYSTAGLDPAWKVPEPSSPTVVIDFSFYPDPLATLAEFDQACQNAKALALQRALDQAAQPAEAAPDKEREAAEEELAPDAAVALKDKYVQRYLEIYDALKQQFQEEDERLREMSRRQEEEGRQAALDHDPSLALLYKDLVLDSGIITAQEFWKRHAAQVIRTTPLPRAEEPFYHLVPGSFEKNLERFATLLIESPFVRNRYNDLVETGKLRATEFWHRLFHSKFFRHISGEIQYRGSSMPVGEGDAYFDNGLAEESTAAGGAEATVADALFHDLDSRTAFDAAPSGFGITTQADDVLRVEGGGAAGGGGALAASDVNGLIERLNRHAAKAVEARARQGGPSACHDDVSRLIEQIEAGGGGAEEVSALLALETAIHAHVRAGEASPPVPDGGLMGKVAIQRRAHEPLPDLVARPRAPSKPAVPLAPPAWAAESQVERLPDAPPRIKADAEARAQLVRAIEEASDLSAARVSEATERLIAKCCLVKFTTILSRRNGPAEMTEAGRQARIQELLNAGSADARVLLDRIADVQLRLQDIVHAVYSCPHDQRTPERKWRLNEALVALKDALQQIHCGPAAAPIHNAASQEAAINPRQMKQYLNHVIERAIQELAKQ